MMYEIKRGSLVVAEVRAEGVQDVEGMVKDRLEVKFKLPSHVQFAKGDTIDAFGQTYKLNRGFNAARKHDSLGIEYNLEFEALYYDLGKWLLRGLDKNNDLNTSEVFLMADAESVLDLIVRNANRVDSGWTVGDVVLTEARQFTFVNMSLLAVLTDLATQYESEFWVEGKTIHFYKKEIDSGLNLSFGKGKGLYNLYRNRTDTRTFNRLMIEGGTKNIPSGYGFTRLQLPVASRPYLENIAPGEEVVEHSIHLDHIFPSRTGTITALGSTNLQFIDSTIDFDLNTPSLSAKISFTSGLLSPFGEFNIVAYDNDTKKITIESKEDKAYPGGIPSAEMYAAVGDKYVLSALELPTSYITAKEIELAIEGNKILNQGIQDEYEYGGDLTPNYVNTHEIELEVGSSAQIIDEELDIDVTLRIAGFQRDLQNPESYKNIIFKEALKPSQIVTNRNDQSRIQYAVQNWSNMSPTAKSDLIDQLSALAGYLFLNGIKVKAGFADEAAYAQDSDKWDGFQFADYLNQGVRSGDQPRFAGTGSSSFVSGFAGSGWRIDPISGDIHATFDHLTIRKSMNVYELIINQIRATNGSLWVTDAARISAVTVSGSNWVCSIDTAGGTKGIPFMLNDILRCQRWDGRSIVYYTARVTAVTSTTFTITRIDGSSAPGVGDEVVRTGNSINPARQGAIYMTSSDSNAPYMDVLDGVTGASFEGKTKVRLGKLDGIVDPDMGALSGYGLYGQNVNLTGRLWITGGNAATQDYAVAQANAARIAAEGVAGTLFSNLKVGGRNFLLDSATDLPMQNNNNATDPATIAWDAVEGCYYVSKLTGQAGSNISTYSTILFASARVSNDFDPAQEWIGSYWVKSQHAITIHLFLGTGSSPIAHSIPANTWVQIYDTNTSGVRFPGLVVNSPVRDSKIWFKHAKLEYGNKPTDWSPAPEDTDAAVAALKTYAEGYAQSQANIAQLAAVSAASADATTKANNAVTSAQNMLNALSVGGRNLIRNGNFSSGSNWTIPTGATLVTLPNGQTAINLNVTTAGTARNIVQADIAFQRNTKYTFSLWVKANTPTNRFRIVIHQYGDGNNNPSLEFLPSVTTEFQKFTFSFTSSNLSGKTNFRLNMLNFTDSTLDNLIIYGVKLEIGDKATDWTPAPEDVDAAIALADSKAVAAQAAYSTLTATLKATAFQDIEQWAIGGNTLMIGGLINTLLLNAAAIKANIINADYLNTLELDAKIIRFGQLSSLSTSLINNPSVTGHLQGWTQGGTGTMAIDDVDLNGVLTPAVRLRTTADLQIYTNWFDVDPSKIYEITVWMHCGSATTNGKYFGVHATSTVGGTSNNLAVPRITTGGVVEAASNNTYFWNSSAATGWRKMVAYLLPTDFEPTDVVNMGVGIIRHVVMPTNAKRFRLRFLNYSNAGTQRDVYVASPTVVEVSERAFQLASSIRGQAAGAESAALLADSKAVEAQAAATTANTNATNAINQLNNLAADNQLTPAEKLQLKTRWDEIVAEYAEIVQSAARVSVPTTDFAYYYSILAPYVIGLLSNMTTTTSVVRATYNNNFAQYYAARAIIIDEINLKTKQNHDSVISSLSTLASNYNNLGDLAHEDLVEWAKISGELKSLGGGHLKATLIDVDALVVRWLATAAAGFKRIIISQSENNLSLYNALNQKLFELDDDSTPSLDIFYLEFNTTIPIEKFQGANIYNNHSMYNANFQGSNNPAYGILHNFATGFPKFFINWPARTLLNGNKRYYFRYANPGVNFGDPTWDVTLFPQTSISKSLSSLNNVNIFGAIGGGHTRFVNATGETLDSTALGLDSDIILNMGTGGVFYFPKLIIGTTELEENTLALSKTFYGRIIHIVNKSSSAASVSQDISTPGPNMFLNDSLSLVSAITVPAKTTYRFKIVANGTPESVANWKWCVV